MLLSPRAARCAAAAAIVAGAVLVGTAPCALADPPPAPAPGCSAADFEQVTSSVSAATSDYLFGHPDVNAFFSSLRGQSKDQVRTQMKTYLANNPQTQSDLAGIRQPLHDMKGHCR